MACNLRPYLCVSFCGCLRDGPGLDESQVAESMLSDGAVAFLIRCGAWALLVWALWSQPTVKTRTHGYRDTWIAAWRVDVKDCNARAYGLLFKGSRED